MILTGCGNDSTKAKFPCDGDAIKNALITDLIDQSIQRMNDNYFKEIDKTLKDIDESYNWKC